MICKRFLLFFLLALFLCPNGYAKAGNAFPYSFKRAIRISDAEHVIDETQVWSIACADASGGKPAPAVYLGTNEGLFVFDGARLSGYRSTHISSIRDLEYDGRSGRIYASGTEGFGWWEEDRFGLMEYHPLLDMGNSAVDQDFWKVKTDSEGCVYFQSHSRIYKYDPEEGSLLPLIEGGHFRYMHSVDGEIFVQSGEILCKLESSGLLKEICRAEDRIMDIIRCDGKRIAALERSGLAELGDDGKLHPLDRASNRILSDAKILSLTTFRNKRILVGTTSQGLYLTESDGSIVADSEALRITSNATVLDVKCDANGDVWTGMEAGAARIDTSSEDYYLEDSRLGRVRAMVQLDEGSYLVGSNKGAFIWRDGVFHPIAGTTGSVWNVAGIGGKAYLAHDLGLFSVDARGRARLLYGGSGVLSIARCNTDKLLYICGTYDGLILLRENRGRLEFVSRIEKYDGFSRVLRLDAKDNIWTRDARSGFIRLSLDSSRTRILDRKDFSLVKNPQDHVFFSEMDGELLMCCNREAYRVDPETSDLVRHEEGCSLLEACGGAVSLIQKDGKWWYNGSNGSGTVRRSPGKGYEREGSIFGALGQTRNQADLCPLDGCIGLGLLGGVALSRGPRIVSESLYISGVEMMGASRQALLPLDEDRVDVPFNMNTLKVSLAGNLGEEFFEYRIVQNDGGWHAWRLGNPVQLSSMNFGNHTLEFRIPGNEDPACSLRIHIRRPWYISHWMIVLYILIVLSIILFLRQYYRRKTRKAQEHARLKAELKSKSEELANITFNSARRKNQLNEIRRMLTGADMIHHPSEVARVSRETVAQIDSYLLDESEWQKSEEYFNIIYDGLLDKLRAAYPSLSKTDLKICVYVKLNLSTKEIADLMNISSRSVEMARYRLRKRLDLPPGQDIGEFLRTAGMA